MECNEKERKKNKDGRRRLYEMVMTNLLHPKWHKFIKQRVFLCIYQYDDDDKVWNHSILSTKKSFARLSLLRVSFLVHRYCLHIFFALAHLDIFVISKICAIRMIIIAIIRFDIRMNFVKCDKQGRKQSVYLICFITSYANREMYEWKTSPFGVDV